jgi:hypothetical protein
MFRQLLITFAFVASIFANPLPQEEESVPSMTIAPFSPGPTPRGPYIEVGPDGTVAAKDPPFGSISEGPKGVQVSGPLGTFNNAKGPGGISFTPNTPKGINLPKGSIPSKSKDTSNWPKGKIF